MDELDRDVMARTIYGEARGESQLGRIAVGRCILNRFRSGRWYAGKTIADTCKKPWQFSCWNLNDPNRVKLLNATADELKDALAAVDSAERGEGPDWLANCTHYHTLNTHPTWAAGQTPAGQIGDHLFYSNID